jgi:hypothetical protein
MQFRSHLNKASGREGYHRKRIVHPALAKNFTLFHDISNINPNSLLATANILACNKSTAYPLCEADLFKKLQVSVSLQNLA